jgi:hypothetical protein
LTQSQLDAKRQREAQKQREAEKFVALKQAKGAVARGEFRDVEEAMAAMLSRIDRQPRATA